MKNSRVWNHFNMVNKTKSQCIHCLKIISKNGGTSNLKKHLSRKHQEFCSDLEQRNPRIPLDYHPMLQDEEKLKNFIYMVQMNAILYTKINDKELTDYEKQNCNAIWEEIALEFEIGATECRKIWLILRKQYAMYLRTKDIEKCKYINELAFLEEYLQKSHFKKIPSVDDDISSNNYDLENGPKKVLISLPEISDTPIHEISVNKTELLDDDENSTQDYEVLYEEYDPILVKNQTLEESVELDHNNETDFPDKNEWNINQSSRNYNERYHHATEREKSSNRYEYHTEESRNNNQTEDRYHSHNRMQNQTQISKPKSQNNFTSPKRIKKSTDNMDEIDFFFEFLQRKLRKMSADLCRQLQMKFMETIQEAEQRSRKHVDRGVGTKDS